MLIDAHDSCLLVVDLQERLLPAVAAADGVIANTRTLIAAAARLEVPILVSEQYRRGLGPTVAPVAETLPAGVVVEKMTFSCLRDAGFAERHKALGRGQAVVAGTEAHVCVLQTVDDLLAAGVDVFVVADATSSRTPASHAAALRRLANEGARIVTTEMVVFEWLERAGTPVFKELSALIK